MSAGSENEGVVQVPPEVSDETAVTAGLYALTFLVGGREPEERQIVAVGAARQQVVAVWVPQVRTAHCVYELAFRVRRPNSLNFITVY